MFPLCLLSQSDHASRLLAQPVGKVSVRAGRIKSGRSKRKAHRHPVDTQEWQGTNTPPSTYLAGPQGTHEPHEAASVPMAQGWCLIVPSYEHKDLGTAFSKPRCHPYPRLQSLLERVTAIHLEKAHLLLTECLLHAQLYIKLLHRKHWLHIGKEEARAQGGHCSRLQAWKSHLPVPLALCRESFPHGHSG